MEMKRGNSSDQNNLFVVIDEMLLKNLEFC